MAKHAVLSSGTKLWRSMACPKSELRLDLTLACGQSFRWRETAGGHWTGVMGGRVWTLTQTDDTLWYHISTNQDKQRGRCGKQKRAGVPLQDENGTVKRFKDAPSNVEEESAAVDAEQKSDVEAEMLRDYFQLQVNLGDLYKEWSAADDHFKQVADIFPGVRMLRQDPTECLFSFICTSNNHISRIQGMVERLCRTLGAPLCQLDQTTYHEFPSLSVLAGALMLCHTLGSNRIVSRAGFNSSVEACLRDLGFGYRARFLQQSAKQILDTHGPQWLESLRGVPYIEARDALRTLPGVGTKVADCVCLMSLDKSEAVPVDTHVWQIAKRDYKYAAGGGQKTLTDKLHRDIGDFFRKLWGSHAGWAHSVLFCADLKKFQSIKETGGLKQPKKETGDEERCKKKAVKGEPDGNEINPKTKSKCQKNSKMSVKKEQIPSDK